MTNQVYMTTAHDVPWFAPRASRPVNSHTITGHQPSLALTCQIPTSLTGYDGSFFLAHNRPASACHHRHVTMPLLTSRPRGLCAAIALLVAACAMFAPSHATVGVDVSSRVTTSAFQCLKRAGYEFAIIRCYESVGRPGTSLVLMIRLSAD